jgi:hypothetical protein
MLESIHSDLLKYIFEFLLPADLALVRFVCLRWRSIIPRPKNKLAFGFTYVKTVNVMKWANSKGFRLSEYTFKAAVRMGSIPVMDWLDDLGHSKRYDASSTAAEYGQLEALKWLKQHGHTFNYGIDLTAAENNHVHILEYLLSINHVISDWVMYRATANNSLNVLKWACEQRNMLVKEEHIAIAIKNGYLDILIYLYPRRPALTQIQDLYTIAEQHNQLHIMEWLLKQ